LYGLLQAGSPNDRLLPRGVLAVLGRDQTSLSSAPINLQTVAWHYIADPATDSSSSITACTSPARTPGAASSSSRSRLGVAQHRRRHDGALIDQAGSVGELLRSYPS